MHRAKARSCARREAAAPRHLLAPTPAPRQPASTHGHRTLTRRPELHTATEAQGRVCQPKHFLPGGKKIVPPQGTGPFLIFQSELPKPHQALVRSLRDKILGFSLCLPVSLHPCIATDTHTPKRARALALPLSLSRPGCQGLWELYPLQRPGGKTRGAGKAVLAATNILATL